MMKKKLKKKRARTNAKRASKAKNKEVRLDPSGIRKEIAAKVEAQADDLADAVIEEGKKGQLATVKYLFEVAHIYPEGIEVAELPEKEESLAATLLNKLGIPTDPVIHDLYERGEDIVMRPRDDAPAEVATCEKENETELKGEECGMPTPHA